jgi:regulator of replication initiation timing
MNTEKHSEETDRHPENAVPPETDEKQDWQQMCIKLKEEKDQLQAELTRLQVENDQFRKALGALLWEDFGFDKDELLAQVGKGQSLEEFVAELEAEGNPDG